MSDLKPCPFCGAPGRTKASQQGLHYFAECSGAECPVGPITNAYRFVTEAIAAWNRREVPQ